MFGEMQSGAIAPLIDVLQRALWLIEHHPAKLAEFFDQARPNVEQLRLVAQALAGLCARQQRHDAPQHNDQRAISTAQVDGELVELGGRELVQTKVTTPTNNSSPFLLQISIPCQVARSKTEDTQNASYAEN